VQRNLTISARCVLRFKRLDIIGAAALPMLAAAYACMAIDAARTYQ
jgi:hypothetical protein